MVEYGLLIGLTELIVLTVGVVITLQQITDMKESRQRENLLVRLQSFDLTYHLALRDFSSQEWGSTFEDFRSHSIESQAYFELLMMRYNNVGIMLKEKMMEPEMLYQLFNPEAIMDIWETIENIVNNYRETKRYPTFIEAFEYLYNDAKKRFPNIITNRDWAAK